MPEQPAPPNKCRLKPEKASDGIFIAVCIQA
ncbi:hypothetical protein M671_09960 [Neisseria gonorrhoeae CH811]|nr:hypothetical protein T556_07630 [Neisseria gonorrhoeae NG-k51.05]KLR94861.1 hypothetical protein M678_06920 [Neisseria gonorrhoeae SK7461]KLS09812.1 hypothetical protein M716_01870 [Neisseria gonorrhoeae SK32402]KLS82469.1 hypothetical protein M786_10265 [Neisseria gonorrhoeae MU_NG21]KLS85156.1 hypothetical protein M774_06200 [Neisseria gonorrhoeae MU_NG5]KLS88621.1 hypothetical protein M775_06000 [Neisseria gonorrhoeae MU_NG6]KLT00034.1 hypothetical protein M671_09960 [Neisseria gonorrho